MASVNTQTPQPVYPKSHVGFDSITSQIEKKLLKRGFQFNIICVGTLRLANLWIASSCKQFWHRATSANKLLCRPNWTRQVDPDQYHLRLAPPRLEGPPRSR